jgi:hypothetical protein
MTDLEDHTVAACAYIHVHIGVRLSSLARLYTTSNELLTVMHLCRFALERSCRILTLLIAKIFFQIALLSLTPRPMDASIFDVRCRFKAC